MKKFLASIAAGIVIFSGSVKALDGEIIFRDAMYGTAIGSVGGIALYAIDGGKDSLSMAWFARASASEFWLRGM